MMPAWRREHLSRVKKGLAKAKPQTDRCVVCCRGTPRGASVCRACVADTERQAERDFRRAAFEEMSNLEQAKREAERR